MTTWTTVAVFALVATSRPLVASMSAASLLEYVEAIRDLAPVLGLGGFGGLAVWLIKRFTDAYFNRTREHAAVDIDIKKAKVRRIDAVTDNLKRKDEQPTSLSEKDRLELEQYRRGELPGKFGQRRQQQEPGGSDPPSGPA